MKTEKASDTGAEAARYMRLCDRVAGPAFSTYAGKARRLARNAARLAKAERPDLRDDDADEKRS